ncbi:MAG TPA: pyridoxal phosphate-dependent aminotransferase [Acidobacteriota bacterium]
MIPLARRLQELAPSATLEVLNAAAARRARGLEVVDLGPGEPDYPTPEPIRAAAIEALDQGFTHYTPAGGTRELRAAIADNVNRRYGSAYPAAEVVVGAGAKQVLFNIFQVLLDPGDEVVLAAPYWVSFPAMIETAGGRVAAVLGRAEDNFTVHAAPLLERVGPKTRAVVINSPCNPTGAVMPPAELERLVDGLAGRPVLLISDECYEPFVYDGAPVSAAQYAGRARERMLVAYSFSKSYAMTGWRIGYGIGPRHLIDAMINLQSHSTSNPNSIAQQAALAALNGSQQSVTEMVAEFKQRRRLAMERLGRISALTCVEPAGAFYLFVGVGKLLGGELRDDVAFAARLLEQDGVAVVPGTPFGCPGFIRLSYATSRELLLRGLDLLDQFAKRYQASR